MYTSLWLIKYFLFKQRIKSFFIRTYFLYVWHFYKYKYFFITLCREDYWEYVIKNCKYYAESRIFWITMSPHSQAIFFSLKSKNKLMMLKIDIIRTFKPISFRWTVFSKNTAILSSIYYVFTHSTVLQNKTIFQNHLKEKKVEKFIKLYFHTQLLYQCFIFFLRHLRTLRIAEKYISSTNS